MKKIFTLVMVGAGLVAAAQTLSAQVGSGTEAPDFATLKEVTRETFIGHEEITELNLPEVLSIGESSFSDLRKVERVVIGRPDRSDDIYMYCIDGLPLFADEGMPNLKSLIIHTSGNNEGLYPNMEPYPQGAYNFVPSHAGFNSPMLSEVVLPHDVQYIQDAFCTGSQLLTEVTLPPMVSVIKGAFYGCPNLRTVTVTGGYVPEIDDVTFGDRASMTLIVPKGFKGAYEADPQWSLFGTITESDAIDAPYTAADMPARGEMMDPDDWRNDLCNFRLLDADAGTVSLESYRYKVSGFYADGKPIFTALSRMLYYAGPRPDARGIVTDREGREYRITDIGRFAYHNHMLDDVMTIPATVTWIGKHAFENDTKAHAGMTVRMMTATPPVCEDNSVFGDKSVMKLEVPVGAREAYMAAEVWREFGSVTESADLGSVDAVTADGEAAAPEYYTIDGRRVTAPTRGLYIVRRGAAVTREVR